MNDNKRLKRTDILSHIRVFQRTHQVYVWDMVIGYGAAMVLHGLREDTSDIDIDVLPCTYKRLLEAEEKVEGFGLVGPVCEITDQISMHPSEIPGEDVILIDGIPVHTLQAVRRFKMMIAYHPDRRPEKIEQDLKDIEQIDKRLASQ